MNVLLTSMEYPPYVGGGATYAHDLAHDLANEGAKVTVLTSFEDEGLDHKGPVRVLRSQVCADTLRTGALSPALLNVMRNTIDTVQPDIIHAHHTAPILALKALDEAHPHPSVYTQHRTPELPGTNVKTDGKGMMAEMAYRTPGYGKWIAPSHFFARKLIQAAVDPEDISVIWPSIDHTRFGPQDMQNSKDILKDALEQRDAYDDSYTMDKKLVVLPVVDRPRKDIRFALDAIGELDEPVQVLVTGINESQSPIYNYAQRYPNIAVIPHGYIPDAAMNSLYNTADAVVVSATHEGFGLAALEAAATGSNVCVRNSPGLQEIASNIPWMRIAVDRHAMAEDIAASLAKKPTSDERMDRAKCVQAIFDPKVRAQKHLDVYRGVAKQEYTAHGLLVRSGLGSCAVGLIHNEDGSFSLPKVRLQQGENWHGAAVRSVRQAFDMSAQNGVYELFCQAQATSVRTRTYTFEAYGEQDMPLTPLDEDVIKKVRSDAEQIILREKLKEYTQS